MLLDKSVDRYLNIVSNIKAFTFCRFYYNQTAVIISTEELLYKHFFAKKVNFVMPLPERQSCRRFYYLTASEGDYQEVLHDAIAHFGVAGALNYVHVQPQYCDFYAFCVGEKNLNYMNKLIAQLDYLEKFCTYFHEQIKSFLNKNSSIIVLPQPMHIDFNPIYHWVGTKKDYFNKQFCEKVQVKKYMWCVNGIEGAISNKEFQCLELFLHGFNAKAVANELKLSSHTVDTYIRNIKQRFGINTRLDLLKFFEQTFYS